MMYNFLPEISLVLCLLVALAVKGFLKKNLNLSLVLIIPLLTCLLNYDNFVKADFFWYLYQEHLVKFIICCIYFCVCRFIYRNDATKQLATLLVALGTMIAFSCSDFITFALSSIFLITVPSYFFMGKGIAFSSHNASETMDRKAKIYIIGGVLSSALLLLAIILIYSGSHSVNFGDISHMLSFASERSALSYAALLLILISSIISISFLLLCAIIIDNDNTALTFFLLQIVHTMLFSKIFSGVFYHLNMDSAFLSIACVILIMGSVFLWIEKTMLRIMAYLAVYNFGISLMLCLNNGPIAAKGYVMLFLSEILCFSGFFTFLAVIKRGMIPGIHLKCDSAHDNTQIAPSSAAATTEKCLSFAVSIPIFFLSLAALQPVLGTFAKFYTCISLLEDEHMIPVIIFLIIDCVRIICLVKMLQKIWLKETDSPITAPASFPLLRS